MIFLILGTQKFQLNRLLIIMDQYAEEGLLQDEIFAQIGHSDYIPKFFRYERFLDKQAFDTSIAESDLIITHSGVGSITSAINAQKPVIVFPRLAKHREHVDDHQLDIATVFAKKKYVLCCDEEDDLLALINRSKTFMFERYVSQTDKIVELIKQHL